MKLGKSLIDRSSTPYLIAELSANHGGSLETAIKTVHAAKASGAHAIKLQTYTADTMTLKNPVKPFAISGGTLWDGRTLYDLYQEASTPWEWHGPIKAEAEKIGLDFFSSAFDESAVAFLEELGVIAHKVASFEITDHPLIECMAETGRPLIISTGMATFEEITAAVAVAKRAGAKQIALLKCTSSYPAPAEEMNLMTIPHLAEAFGCPAGLSDHTLGISVPIAATALGARIIEKHFILSRANGGPDSGFSLEPQEFKAMAEAVDSAWRAIGEIHYAVTDTQKKSLVFRRSLYAVKAIKAGEAFSSENVKALRPAQGLSPTCYATLMGKAASQDIAEGTPLDWDLVGDA